jgi:hypothetical protein
MVGFTDGEINEVVAEFKQRFGAPASVRVYPIVPAEDYPPEGVIPALGPPQRYVRSQSEQTDAPARPVVLNNGHIMNGRDESIPYVQLEEPAGSCFRVTVQDFGGQAVEVLAVYQSEKQRRASPGKPKTRGKREEISLENIERAEVRARVELRKKIMMLKADRVLTLTARADMDFREFERATNKFLAMCRKQWGSDVFQYVLVFERHKENRTSFHAHLALNKYFSVNILRLFWHRALGWCGKGIAKGEQSPGNVDITSSRKGYWNRHKIAKYICKYIGKDVAKAVHGTELANAKRYRSSQNIAKPKRMVFWIESLFADMWLVIKQVAEAVIKQPLVKFWDSPSDCRLMFWYATAGAR